MKPTEELKNEHLAIRFMLEIMTDMSRRLEAGQGADLKDLNDVLAFLRIFADRCHQAKEEQLLFPALEKAGVARERGPIGIMLDEHQAGRSLIKDMDDALNGMARSEDRAGLNFARQARDYAELLSGHIDKEDNVLFPLADTRLDRKTQDSLKKGFERIEREVIGPGRHREFKRLVGRLGKKYLKKTESA